MGRPALGSSGRRRDRAGSDGRRPVGLVEHGTAGCRARARVRAASAAHDMPSPSRTARPRFISPCWPSDAAAGDEVLLTSLNFVAAANTIRHTGATPVFCDITGVDDLNVSPEDIEAAIGPRTRALVVMHYGGHPCRMDAILELATRHGLALIEDAAHAPGQLWRGQNCGTIGHVGCFSFFSNKNLPDRRRRDDRHRRRRARREDRACCAPTG